MVVSPNLFLSPSWARSCPTRTLIFQPILQRDVETCLHWWKVNGRDGATLTLLALKKILDLDVCFVLPTYWKWLSSLPFCQGLSCEKKTTSVFWIFLLHRLSLCFYKYKCLLGIKSCATCWVFSLAKLNATCPWGMYHLISNLLFCLETQIHGTNVYRTQQPQLNLVGQRARV